MIFVTDTPDSISRFAIPDLTLNNRLVRDPFVMEGPAHPTKALFRCGIPDF